MKSDEVASGGWQHWRTSDSDEKWSIHEEGNDYSQRVQSSTDEWIPKDEGTYVWIPKDEGEAVTKNKKARRGQPQIRLHRRERALEKARRDREKRDQASPVEPNDVVKPSSPATGHEGSSSRKWEP